MSDDKQFPYISSAQFHQTGLVHVLMCQTIFEKRPSNELQKIECEENSLRQGIRPVALD
jgi:hypothetical protein